MSNCHLVAVRSLSDLAASRLALRAPALRAATVLTRPNRSAQRLPCGRHTVPTAMTVGPNNIVTNHCVERGDHLTHHRHDRDLRLLSGGLEPVVERPEGRIPIAGAQRCHVEHLAHVCAAAPDAAPTPERAALTAILDFPLNQVVAALAAFVARPTGRTARQRQLGLSVRPAPQQ